MNGFLSGQEDKAKDKAAKAKPISRTAIGLMPIAKITITRCKAPSKAAMCVKIPKIMNAPTAMSKIAVEIIVALTENGKRFTAQGAIVLPQPSGACKI